MIQTIRISAAAEADIRRAREWYDGKEAGLGDSFAWAVNDTVRHAARMPRICPRVIDDARKARVRSFPYLIFFVEEPNEIVVHAVVHERQDRAQIRSRL